MYTEHMHAYYTIAVTGAQKQSTIHISTALVLFMPFIVSTGSVNHCHSDELPTQSYFLSCELEKILRKPDRWSLNTCLCTNFYSFPSGMTSSSLLQEPIVFVVVYININCFVVEVQCESNPCFKFCFHDDSVEHFLAKF